MANADLPEDGELWLGGVELPAGGRRSGEDPQDGPLIWTSDDLVASPGPLWKSVDAPARELGLSVVILDDLSDGGSRPWKSQEMGPPGTGDVGEHDPWDVFRNRWKEYVPIGCLPPEERPSLGLLERFMPPEDVEEEDPEEMAMFLEQVSPWGVQFPGLA